jgi:hypothetical protein
MSMFKTRKSISVEAVSGGWVFDWSDPSLDKRDSHLGTSWPERPRPATDGREIFTDKKKLVKRIGDFL